MMRSKWTGMSLIASLVLGLGLAWVGMMPQQTKGDVVGGGCYCQSKTQFQCNTVQTDYTRICTGNLNQCDMNGNSNNSQNCATDGTKCSPSQEKYRAQCE